MEPTAMNDYTLPLKGGWVLCRKVPPTQIRPAFLGLYYAMPEKIFERGAFEWGHMPSGLDDKMLAALYRQRQRARLSEHHQQLLIAAVRKLTGQRFAFDVDPAPLFDDSTADELSDAENIEPRPLPALDEIELEMRVRIVTPDGEVCLEPHEFSIVTDIQPYMDELGNGYEMRELGGIKNAKKLHEQLFYVMSRGIPKTEAYSMLLGTVDRPNVFWLQPHSELQSMFSRAA
jgi:hypothetical protein